MSSLPQTTCCCAVMHSYDHTYGQSAASRFLLISRHMRSLTIQAGYPGGLHGLREGALRGVVLCWPRLVAGLVGARPGCKCTHTQHSTAQHSTAQHSTAQHSTAQHSKAAAEYARMMV
jgi:hypothetical protein